METRLSTHQSLQPTYTERVRDIFDRYADLYNRIAYGEAWQQENKALAKFFDDEVFPQCDRKVQRVLDVGCGTGIPSIGLAEMGYDVVGFDLSPNMVRVAQENSTHLPNAEFTVRDWGEVGPDTFEGMFDVVIFKGAGIDLIETEAEAKSLLNSLYRLVKEGGVLYLTLRNWEVALEKISENPVKYVNSHPIVMDGNIHTLIYKYERVDSELFVDIIFQEVGKDGSSEAFTERIKALEVTKEKLKGWAGDLKYNSYTCMGTGAEKLMGNKHISYIFTK